MKRWFKNFIHAKQMINPEFATHIKNKLALIYLIGAWNIFGLTIAVIYKEKVPKIHDSVDYAKVLGLKDATVVKMANFSVVDQYDIKLSEEELEDFKNIIGTKEELEKYDKENEKRIKAEKDNEKNTNN